MKTTKTARLARAAWVLGAVLCATLSGRAFIMETGPIPFARLLANAERRLREAPEIASSHYSIARLHFLAFSQGLMLGGGGRDGQDSWFSKRDLSDLRRAHARELAYDDLGLQGGLVPPGRRTAYQQAYDKRLAQVEQSGWTPATSLPAGTLAGHAAAAMEEITLAAKLDAKDVHYRLCQGCLIERFLEWSEQVKLKTVPPSLRGADLAKARQCYLEAFRLGFEESSRERTVFGALEHMAVYEAGTHFLRLTDQNQIEPSADGPNSSAEVIAALTQMRTWKVEQPIELVSPILFSLSPGADLGRLLDTTARVDFDLRGYGPAAQWSWIRPEAGLLVWDPEKTGVITSGRQLFGNYTFQIARATGYEALAALDDDGDGFLRGAELAGLRVWFDRNGNGRSDPGEVVDLAECGIVALAVRATRADGIHPTNLAGVIFADGHTLPTWDWMAEPIRN